MECSQLQWQALKHRESSVDQLRDHDVRTRARFTAYCQDDPTEVLDTAGEWIRHARKAGQLEGMNYNVGRQADG